MIGSLAPGDALPGQPTGPFGLSETMNTGQLLQSAHQPLLECVLARSHSRRGWDPSLGWSQAGIHGNVSMPQNLHELTPNRFVRKYRCFLHGVLFNHGPACTSTKSPEQDRRSLGISVR